MLSKITTADARKKFANLINRVAFGKESFVLTRRGEPIAALVSIKGLQLLQDLEDKIDMMMHGRLKMNPANRFPGKS